MKLTTDNNDEALNMPIVQAHFDHVHTIRRPT
uniref:Uncharacterized protein n=1 Tax=Setaria italica TaxID=4555 RepID=K3Y3W2_SETIT